MKVEQSLETPYEGDELTRATRQKIDNDISELKCRIQSLSSKRNELSPISVLPPEVLSSIFILIRDLCPEILPQSSSDPVPWIHVGHICRRWREIALSDPNLWSVPAFTRPNLAQEMIRRSKMVPLTIRSITDSFSLKALEQLQKGLAQIARIRSIELVLGRHPRRRLKGIFSTLLQPHPLLEDLYLAGTDISLPLDTLSKAPRLQSIFINCIDIYWESAIFKHTALTDLRLRCTVSGASTMGQMMNTLHHLPNLRILALEHSIPPYTASDGNIGTVDFKFPERLEIEAKEGADCNFFLRYIQYPSSTTVKLTSFETSAEDGMAIISLLGQNLYRVQNIEAGVHHSPVVIRSARVTSCLNDLDTAFSNRTDSINQLDETGGPDTVVQIRFCRRSGDDHPQKQFLTPITNSFDLSLLEELLFDLGFEGIYASAIQDSFGKLLKLKVINISKSLLLPEICFALAGTSRGENPKDNPAGDPSQSQETSQHSSPVVLFPALETLMIQAVDFRLYRPGRPEIIDCLIDMLIKCSNVDTPIENLSLEQCRGVRTSQIRLLGELVVHLEVDGQVVDVRELGPDGWSDYSDEDEYSGEDDSSDEYEEDENEY